MICMINVDSQFMINGPFNCLVAEVLTCNKSIPLNLRVPEANLCSQPPRREEKNKTES
jgi:hypothetical protein